MLSAKLKEAAGNSADATLYVDDVFSTWPYTGNGSTQTITNGIDLAGKGGMVWVKSRSAATDHKLTDTVRGATKALISDTTGAQTTDTNGLTAFSSTGFSIGTDSVYNTNAATYASWTFRKAAKFFDVVTYTGTGSARTIAHNLGVAPGMVIVKRTDTTGNWQVYHRSLSSAAYSIQLNLTAAQASAPTVWNSTAPTSSVFSVGTDASVNASGGTYVAYLYAHDTSSTGIIQCGSYTTDASAFGTNVNLGWQPQLVLVKSATSTSAWNIMDTMRGFTASEDNYLYPNLANAEVSGGPIAVNATGFKDGGQIAVSSTIIYMAIRMPNKPPTTGTQVYIPVATTVNSANFPITTNFPVSLVMSKVRSGYHTYLLDRLRGDSVSTYVRLSATNSNAEVTGSNGLGLDNNTGFIDNFDIYDGGSADYIFWNFKRAPEFFDEVCYTGTGSAQNVTHNLTVAPELVIIKSRRNGGSGYGWVTGSSYYPSWGRFIQLETTDAVNGSNNAGPFNNTAPTLSVLTVNTWTETNGSGATYVAYLFATLAGISKVGSYTGNGTGQAIACGFGSAGARFVLIKRTDSTGSWYTFDSARGLTSGSSPYLLLNSTAAEVTGNNGVYASSGGFTLGATASTTTNINGASYIYLSVA